MGDMHITCIQTLAQVLLAWLIYVPTSTSVRMVSMVPGESVNSIRSSDEMIMAIDVFASSSCNSLLTLAADLRPPDETLPDPLKKGVTLSARISEAEDPRWRRGLSSEVRDILSESNTECLRAGEAPA